MASAFFYGTLMHPKILKRVIGHDGSDLRIGPALLLDYTRHKIKGADYPGIVPYAQSRGIFDRELDREDRCVRGTMVTGLSDEDMRLLDVFEGDEYTRQVVSVYRLGPSVALDDVEVVPKDVPPIPLALSGAVEVEVEVYVWCEPLFRLERRLWRFDEFVSESVWKWVGVDRADYTEVDRRRAMDGNVLAKHIPAEILL